MRKFRFRLETVLDYRTVVEELKHQEVAGLLEELRKSQVRIESFRAKIDAAFQHPIGAEDTGALIRRELYVDAMQREIDVEAVRFRKIEMRLEAARSELIAASQAKKAIMRIKERDVAKWRRDALAAEQTALDEVATIRHSRRV